MQGKRHKDKTTEENSTARIHTGQTQRASKNHKKMTFRKTERARECVIPRRYPQRPGITHSRQG